MRRRSILIPWRVCCLCAYLRLPLAWCMHIGPINWASWDIDDHPQVVAAL